MTRSINIMQQLLDIGKKCIAEGKAEQIADKVYRVMLSEIEKLRAVRGESLYQYANP